MVVAVAPFIDASISKTVNAPEACSYDDFQALYRQAWRHGLKGMTAFRPMRCWGPCCVRACTRGRQARSWLERRRHGLAHRLERAERVAAVLDQLDSQLPAMVAEQHEAVAHKHHALEAPPMGSRDAAEVAADVEARALSSASVVR